jgi:CHAT domain-containing protein
MMTEAARVWAAAGRPVIGITPSQSARNTLAAGVSESYNAAQFLGHLPGQRGGRRPLDIAEGVLLLIDESSMIPTPDLSDLVSLAEERSAKMVLAGDTGQLQAVETGNADEFTGLPAGFLQAGAACAIVSMWQVNDRATAILMVRLYELLLSPVISGDTAGPVTALREARTWLRHLTATELDAYIQSHPPLANYFASVTPASSSSLTTEPETRPYAAPQYWAAFTAWGT